MMNKLEKRNGFTLAEILIVIAIIGVLVAAAVPLFSGQLEKSREATDLANIRAAYSELMTTVISEENYDFSTDVSLKQKKDDWQTANAQATLEKLATVVGVPEKDGGCTVSWDKTNSKPVFQFSGSLLVSFPSSGGDLNEYHMNFAKAYADYIKLIKDTDLRQGKIAANTDKYGILRISPTTDEWRIDMVNKARSDGYSQEVLDELSKKNYMAYFAENGDFLAVRSLYTKGSKNVWVLQFADGGVYTHDTQQGDLTDIVADHYGISAKQTP